MTTPPSFSFCSHALDIGQETLSEELLDSFLEMMSRGLAQERASSPSVRRVQHLPQIE